MEQNKFWINIYIYVYRHLERLETKIEKDDLCYIL